MTLPNLGLNAAVVTAIRYAPTHSLNPTVELWRRLTDNLTEEEAQQIPQSLRYVLPLVASDAERRRLLASLAVSLDLFETLPGLLETASVTKDAELLLGAAALATHPGVELSWGKRVRSAVREIPLSIAQMRALEIRLNPNTEASGPLEVNLRSELWPGLQDNGRPPFVALDELGAPATVRWRLAARFLETGAMIRRLPAEWKQRVPSAWFASRSVIVSWTEDPLQRLRSFGLDLDASQLILAPHFRGRESRILARASQILGRSLRLEEEIPEQPLLLSAVDPEVIRLGAFDSLDMAYLGAATRRVVYRLANEEVLRPRSIRNSHVWSFGQLVALRTWRYFQSISGSRRYPVSLLRRLERLAQAPTPTDIGVTSDGRVWQKSNGEFHDIDTGQEVIEGVVSLDRIFRPFPIGGRQAPMLPRPSPHTLVHPALFGGTPSLAELRLPVRTVMSVYRKHDRSVVQTAYPELSRDQLQECVEIGSIMEALA